MGIELLERRRILMAKIEKAPPAPLLYPDAYYVVFSGKAGVSKQITYNSSRINRYVLDGVEYNPSSAVYTVTPSTDGNHTLYFWLRESTRLPNNFSAKYLRIPVAPFGWHGAFVYDSTINQIDCLSEVPYSINDVFGQWCTFQKIRVPKGSGSAYKEHQYWSKWKNIIEETNDFNYNIE